MNSPAIPRHPLDHANVVKFALGSATSAALAASGKFHILLSSPSDSTTPDHLHGRRILLAVECSREALDACYGIASGTHRVVKIKTSKP